MMGAGKSTVGAELASRLGRRFVDLDRWIEARAGASVTAMFDAGRVTEFRALEEAGIVELGSEAAVIATGGGAVMASSSLNHMLAHGLVVYLRARVESLLQRLGAESIAQRPLLQKGDAALTLRTLLDERAASYEHAHAVIDTDARTLREVVSLVERALGPVADHRVVPVPVPESEGGAYDAFIVRDDSRGDVLRAESQRLFADRPRFLLADRDVAARYAHRVRAALGGCPVITVQPGEAAKTLAEVERVAGELVALGIDRSAVLFALGGGALGDLAGFVAATMLRGVDYVHLPTTLMAMVDSSIGGKTAVNLPAGKNLIGAFHQPKLVLSDLSTLSTLAARDRTAGLGEVLKHALLVGESQVAAIEAHADALRQGPVESLFDVVCAAVAYKAHVVAADPRERKRALSREEHATGRITLNLGHTIAHGLETASHQTNDPLRHGEAVLLGLHAEAIIGARLGYWPAGPARLSALMPRLGLHTDLHRCLSRLAPPGVGATANVFLNALQADKKREGGRLRFVLLEAGPGHVREVLLDARRAMEILASEK